MNPNTAHTLCQIGIAVFSILTILCGYGSYHFGRQSQALKDKGFIRTQEEVLTKQNDLLENQQTAISKLDELLESTDHDNRKLVEKYPGGYTLFGVDHSRRFENKSIPHESQLSEQYEFDWNKVRICELTETTVTIEFPSIRYKPLNARIIGWKQTIPRYPTGKSHRLKIELPEAKNRIFLELVKDKSSLFMFAIGFKPD